MSSVGNPTLRSLTNCMFGLNAASLPPNATASYADVIDSSHAVTIAAGGNNSRVGGRAGKEKGRRYSRVKRFTSGPPPEIDQNIEVSDIVTFWQMSLFLKGN